MFIAVTGVSGSGKSTLVNETLFQGPRQPAAPARELTPGEHESVDGLELFDKVIDIDQSPIGRTPRSNPATYTALFDHMRELFALTARGQGARATSRVASRSTSSGGRCEACEGDGTIKIEMHFLPDVYVPCEVCMGARYNRETLEVRYKGKSIADVLEMTVEEALEFFAQHPEASGAQLQTLHDVGLGYVQLGQPATTLSGGEAQRVKLAHELSKRATGRTLYMLDEPTTGLHFADIEQAARGAPAAGRRRQHGARHRAQPRRDQEADWIIDLGPEGGEAGGEVLATGTPEQVAEVKGSATGRYLRDVLPAKPARKKVVPRKAARAAA